MLHTRKVTLRISGEEPVTIMMWKGLPQGAVPSPLLYKIYTNDVNSRLNINCALLKHADDLALYVTETFILCTVTSLTVYLIPLMNGF